MGQDTTSIEGSGARVVRRRSEIIDVLLTSRGNLNLLLRIANELSMLQAETTDFIHTCMHLICQNDDFIHTFMRLDGYGRGRPRVGILIHCRCVFLIRDLVHMQGFII